MVSPILSVYRRPRKNQALRDPAEDLFLTTENKPWLFTTISNTLANDAAAVGLLCLFVKHLGLSRKIVRAFHQIVQLDPTFQDAVNGFVQDLCSFVQIVLDFGNFISCRRILVLLEVVVQRWEGHRFLSCARLPCVSNGGCEVVQELCQQDKSNSGGILGVGNNRPSESVRSNITVNNIILVGDGLALTRLCSLHECSGQETQHLLNRRSLKKSERGELRAHAANNWVRDGVSRSNGG